MTDAQYAVVMDQNAVWARGPVFSGGSSSTIKGRDAGF